MLIQPLFQAIYNEFNMDYPQFEARGASQAFDPTFLELSFKQVRLECSVHTLPVSLLDSS
jgi:hypothetical protein